ncbi:MAG: copper chaperone PCu(A)C [Burkholderiaceae bacterium]|jgi:copper(I)-binding protein|nr:copper chaperone PCu(A)C [Burkholderiaceae bacterium]
MKVKTPLLWMALSAMLAGFGGARAQTPAPHAFAASASAANAAVQVQDAWVRTAVAGQSGTGAFMTLTAPVDMRLTGASTPVAGVTEVHEMLHEGDTMKMRAVQGGLALPAGRPVELKPGGYHIMLMDLKAPLPAGGTVPLELSFVIPPSDVPHTQILHLPVRAAGSNTANATHMHMHTQ